MKNNSFVSNLIYMWKVHWNFNKSFLLILLIMPLISIVNSLLGIILPKEILDGLYYDDVVYIVVKVLLISISLIVIRAGQTQINNKLEIYSWEFFFLYGQEKVNRKKMTVNYQFYSSSNGKNIAEKAFYSVCGNPDCSMVAFFPKLKDLLYNCMGILTFSAILSTLNPLIIVFLLISYTLDAVIAVIVEKQRKKYRQQETIIWRKTNYLTKSTTLAMYAKDIRIYNLKSWINSIRKTVLDEEIKVINRKEGVNVIQLLIESILIFIRDGLVYAYLIYRMLNSEMTLGEFSVYFVSITGFGNWLQNIVSSIQGLIHANNNVTYFREFMHISDGKADGLTVENIHSHTIRLENVSYKYPESKSYVVKNINLQINEGETLGIVGINGAGKTTLIKLICGLLKPTSGHIYIDNIDIDDFSINEYYSCFSVVFQDSCIMPVTIEQNVTLSYETTNKELLDKCIKNSGLFEKINSLQNGLSTKLGKQFDKHAVELSGGEIQKLLLARALYKNAPVFILDEPTSAMDPIAESELYLKYNNLMKGKTSIYISHRLSSTKFCDKIAVLDDSNIIEFGTHEELMQKNGKYFDLYNISSKYYNEVKNVI